MGEDQAVSIRSFFLALFLSFSAKIVKFGEFMSKKANSNQTSCFEISFLINILSMACELLGVNIVRQETDSLSVMC